MASAQPWDRQKGESAQAFEAFELYRTLGPDRSMRVVAERLAKSEVLMKRWSARWQWVDRCRLWDSHAAKAARNAEIEARRQQARDDAKKYRTLASGLIAKAGALLKATENGGLDPATMTPLDAVRFMRMAQLLEESSREIDADTVKDADGFEVATTSGQREISIRIIGPGGVTVGAEAVEAVARQILDQPDPPK